MVSKTSVQIVSAFVNDNSMLRSGQSRIAELLDDGYRVTGFAAASSTTFGPGAIVMLQKTVKEYISGRR